MNWIADAVTQFGWVQTWTFLVVAGMLYADLTALLLSALADGVRAVLMRMFR